MLADGLAAGASTPLPSLVCVASVPVACCEALNAAPLALSGSGSTGDARSTTSGKKEATTASLAPATGTGVPGARTTQLPEARDTGDSTSAGNSSRPAAAPNASAHRGRSMTRVLGKRRRQPSKPVELTLTFAPTSSRSADKWADAYSSWSPLQGSRRSGREKRGMGRAGIVDRMPVRELEGGRVLWPTSYDTRGTKERGWGGDNVLTFASTNAVADGRSKVCKAWCRPYIGL
ncbi:hypothetical protein C8F01DRAFT_1081440 [Mycena amicta]|nr:hypothetical protein C8F01DRAFT_1081440 [Mycena amicta]